jgi:hypothetical protein
VASCGRVFMAVNRGQAGPGERRRHRNGGKWLGQQSGEDSSVERLGDGRSCVEEGREVEGGRVVEGEEDQ